MKLTTQISCVLIILLFLFSVCMQATSIVYYITISQPSRPGAEYHHNVIVAPTPFDRYNKYKNGVTNNVFGLIGTAMYIDKMAYLRIDTAVGKINEVTPPNSFFGRTQWDDLIITGGYGYKFNDTLKMTATGLLGIPLHQDVGLSHAQFGTGHYGLGIQGDGSWIFHYNLEKESLYSLMWAARWVRFLPRCATGSNIGTFNFNLGNLCDIYVAYYSAWKNQWGLEIGYNPSFLFDATICPANPTILNAFHFTRNNYYVYLTRAFKIAEYQSAVVAGISYGADVGSRDYANKYIWVGWLTWAVVF